MTNLTKADSVMSLIRRFLVTIIDRPAFWLLSGVYQIFFNVAEAQIFSSATIREFYYRVQLIIGVFMIFKLSISIIEAIITPDKVTAKQTGLMSIIGRVFIGLIMLTLITPINISNPRNDYERELKNNGLLFGTLYSLQTRILENNTLGRLILGTTDVSTDTQSSLSDTADTFTSAILKAFVSVNLVPKSEREDVINPENNPDYWACKEVPEDAYRVYFDVNADPQEILDKVNEKCPDDDNVYAFAYLPLGGIFAFVFVFILLGFTVDIAIRSIKLAVLRVMAPIPIISYMSPKAKDNGAFGTWVKSLTSTYLDIFIRLGVVYLILYLIQDIITNGLSMGNSSNIIVAPLSFIFICLGLFIFARQAPKFIKDALGMKGPGMSNVGLNALLGGTAMAIQGRGTDSKAIERFGLGLMAGSEGSIQAYNQGKTLSMGQAWSQSSDLMAKIKTGDKDAKGGLMQNAMQHMERHIREGAARTYGIGMNDFAQADYAKDIMKKKVQAIANEYEKLQLALQSNTFDSLKDASGNPYTRDTALARVNELREMYKEAQETLEKAAKAADKMEADRKMFGLDTRPIDRRTETYRSARKLRTEDAMVTFKGLTDSIKVEVAVDANNNYTTNNNEFTYKPAVKKYDYNNPSAPITDDDQINKP